MPSMTGTRVLQVLSLKQNFPCLRLGQLERIYLLGLFDGLEILREFICPDPPATNFHLSFTSWIIKFIVLFTMSPPTNVDPSCPAGNLCPRPNSTPPIHGGLTQLIHHPPRRHPPLSLGMVPPPMLPLIVKTSLQLVLWRNHHSPQ